MNNSMGFLERFRSKKDEVSPEMHAELSEWMKEKSTLFEHLKH
jgi:hypothetical protein